MEAVREALTLSGDPSSVAIREGTDHCSACSDNLAQLLCSCTHFSAQGGEEQRVAAPVNYLSRRDHIFKDSKEATQS